MKRGRGERETWNGREVRRITKREMDERIEEVGNQTGSERRGEKSIGNDGEGDKKRK